MYDLIKLSIIFNNLSLLNNFEMKCRINPDEKNYRGYIYCDSVDELEFVSTNLKHVLDINFINNYKLEKEEDVQNFLRLIINLKK